MDKYGRVMNEHGYEISSNHNYPYRLSEIKIPCVEIKLPEVKKNKYKYLLIRG
jgi:hypothetical protein